MRAKKRIEYLKGLLDKVGIGGERVEMYNISSSMGPQFAKIATDFTEHIRKLGPTPINIAKVKKKAG